MSRPLRVEYPHALYHVISRGNAKQNIYKDNSDRSQFLKHIKEVVELHNLVCHAYCLMDNHYHLLIETPDANLSKAMRDINGTYAQWFNIKYKTVGHLFQSRYKAFLIEKDSYLLEVARYIVLNPVRAGIVNHPRDWKWSSYQHTFETKKTNQWLHTDWILGLFGKNRTEAQTNYQKFIINGINAENPHINAINGFLLGTPQFIHWVWENHTNGSEKLIEHTREQRIVGRPTLEELFRNTKTKKERNNAIKIARFRCGYSTIEISNHIDLHRAVIGKISRET